jgi:hypothetical protein
MEIKTSDIQKSVVNYSLYVLYEKRYIVFNQFISKQTTSFIAQYLKI